MIRSKTINPLAVIGISPHSDRLKTLQPRQTTVIVAIEVGNNMTGVSPLVWALLTDLVAADDPALRAKLGCCLVAEEPEVAPSGNREC